MTTPNLKVGIDYLLYEYLLILKSIQEFGFTPYALENRRAQLHSRILKCLNLDDSSYEKTKDIFDNLDKVCKSGKDDWKLKTNSDCKNMARQLEIFINDAIKNKELI